MKKINKFCRLKLHFLHLFLMFMILLFASCSHDSGSSSKSTVSASRQITVAVVLPLSGETGQSERYHRVAEWYKSTLKTTMNDSGFSKPFSFNFEWYDEEKEELATLATTLANRDDVFAIVGPLYSDHVNTFAEKCFKKKKTLIAPCASSESVIRSFAINSADDDKSEPFLWALTETDVSQAEALLAKAKSFGGTTVSLISGADLYGRTFFSWVPFLAAELGLTMKENVRYTSEYTRTDEDKDGYQLGTAAVPIADAADTALSSGADYVICALSSYEDAEAILNKRQELGDSAPKLLFTDNAFVADFLTKFGDKTEGVEGCAPYADPTSGFAVDYKARFGVTPVVGEAHLYDSLLLCGFAAAQCIKNDDTGTSKFPNKTVNDAIKAFNGSGQTGQPSWNLFGMMLTMKSIDNNQLLKINGATGALSFDSETLTSSLRTVYVHWIVADGQFHNLDFTSSKGGGRTAGNRASWEWSVAFEKVKGEVDKGSEHTGSYGDLKSCWAVIVAASDGWGNYRHQADALYMYQLLKKKGFKDDHIIMILADDIARNQRNYKKPNQVFARINGDNLYTDDMRFDYLLSELTVEDLSNIMKGNLPELNRTDSVWTEHPNLERTPTRLETDNQDDIFWFWSGHGTSGQFVWHGKDKDKGFTTELMKNTLLAMDDNANNHANKRFRKMVICIETCYSGSVFAFDGDVDIDGVLVFTAASPYETSLADVYSVDLKVWISNRFTRNLTDSLNKEESICYADLYKYLVQNTIGSHVQLINAQCFGNLYDMTFKDDIFKSN